MNKSFRQLALPVLMFAFVGAAQAQQRVIDFGQWGSSFFTTDPVEVYYVDTSAGGAFGSGGFASVASLTGNDWIATNWFENPEASFTGSEAFDLGSVWLAGAWGSQTLTFTGYAGDGSVFTTTVYVTTTAQEYAIDFKGIDKFTISTGTDYVQDPTLPYVGLNWAMGSMNITVVPEPETYAMMLAGLALMGVVARRRQKR
ncbi:MAG: PEP-CTERM sorting domain-containing protein [Azoarcus sp.]|jgi:hypothetical protein|nr:PEP-CTERM sorting domain-containing protein [Azoarcus sp.]